MNAMDKLDYLILSELLLDAQMPFSAVAKKVGTSPYTVAKRYERMRREGTIFQSIVSIDLSKVGYQGKAFVLITAIPNKDRSLILDALKKIKNVIVVSEIIGAFDVLAIAPVSDLSSLRGLVKEVKKVPGVQHVEVTCIDDTSFPLNKSFGEVLSKKCLLLAKSTNSKPAA